MRFIVRNVSVAAVLAAAAAGVHAQDIERGRLLYENHCQGCHTSQVHGRANRIVLSRADLHDVVDRWQANQKLGWSEAEIADVAAYLAATRYRLP